MSLTSAMSNALSGLTAAARGAEVVSSNVANALTEGYGRRELELGAQSLAGSGGGVRIEGVQRQVDRAVLADRRASDASLAAADTKAAWLASVEAALGTPDAADSISGRIAGLEAALLDAASRPDAEPRLATAVGAAGDLATALNTASQKIADARLAADGKIASDVRTVNDALSNIASLNARISVARAEGRDALSLVDQRQAEIDRISPIVPIREVARDRGQVALYTDGGAILLDGRAATLGFAPARAVTPEMTLTSGALSGLTIDGKTVSTLESGPLGGGRLAASFSVRDEAAPQASADLDALARDLVERFAGVPDATLVPGDAGLLVDSVPGDEVGLAGRVGLNASVDPAQGGLVLRLRDGLGATSPGTPGNARLLNAFAAALEASRAPASGAFTGSSTTASGLAAKVLSARASERQAADADATFAAARNATVRAEEADGGVDTDREVQTLLAVEKSYAANARVIQTIDDMLATLLRI